MALGQLLKIPTVNDYIFDADFDTAVDEIVKKYQLPLERVNELQELIYAVLDDVVTASEVPALLVEAFGLSEDVAKHATADLLGKTLLPLVVYLPNIESDIVSLGGKLEDYPSLRVEKDESAKKLALEDIVKSLGLSFSDVLVKRLTFLLQQYVSKEKTDASLKTFFTRPLNIGGLGLSDEQATALLAATLPIAAELGKTPEPTPVKVEPVKAAPAPKVVEQAVEIAPSHELVAEVPVTAAPPKPTAKPSSSVPTPPPSPKPKPPLGAPKAAAKPKVDLDFDPDELRLPAKRAVAVRKLSSGTQDSFAAALVLATEGAAAVLKKQKISEKVFADLAGKAIRGLRDMYQTRDLVERDWELKGQELATVMQAIGAGVEAYQSVPQAVAPKPASARMPSEDDELEERFSDLTEKQQDRKIEPTKAQLTVGSSVPKTPDGQRKMVDVMSSARLAGPIEQLGKMTPTEFRRLSSNAAEAAQKIEDLLSALETTSYEERVKGVLAWRESPMNQLYLQIAEEALSQGLALPEVSSRRRAAGKDSLSPAEIKALALLNAKIRF